MTDAEIRVQLAEQIEAEGREIRVESPADGPPLILRFGERLKLGVIARIRQSWQEAWKRDGVGPKIVVIEAGMEIFQLLDGEWRKLG